MLGMEEPAMQATNLSEAALSLLRSYRGDIVMTDANREVCRELASHGRPAGRRSLVHRRP